MGLIWNNEYVLEKNKERHKTSYSSTEAMEMADNCFQVWHCSVNEFVLLCGRLTVSFLSFIFLSFCTHKHTHTHFLISLLFVFALSGLHIYPLLGSLSFFFLLIFFSLAAFFAVAAFFFFFLHLCFTCFFLSLLRFSHKVLTTLGVLQHIIHRK